MAFGKLKPPTAPAKVASSGYPRTIIFNGPKSKRTLKKQTKKSGRL